MVGIAFIIASPIAWYAMNRWQEDFAYRIDIEWWMFALAGIMAVGIALVTVSFQAIRAAVANLVESLRSSEGEDRRRETEALPETPAGHLSPRDSRERKHKIIIGHVLFEFARLRTILFGIKAGNAQLEPRQRDWDGYFVGI